MVVQAEQRLHFGFWQPFFGTLIYEGGHVRKINQIEMLFTKTIHICFG